MGRGSAGAGGSADEAGSWGGEASRPMRPRRSARSRARLCSPVLHLSLLCPVSRIGQPRGLAPLKT